MKLCLETDKGRKAAARKRVEVEDEPYRSEWSRDLARVIHSASYRRLQGKTQLFPTFESDFFRTRLTHSIEVAQIAKSIATRLNYITDGLNIKKPDCYIDLDLIMLTGLAHDLGHPPFGHNGEIALDDKMKEYGGFEGNAQTLRIISKLEKHWDAKYPDYRFIDGNDNRIGLNLTYRSMASLLK